MTLNRLKPSLWILIVLTICLTVRAPPTKNTEKRTCRFAMLFGADGTDLPRDRQTKRYCINVNKTCCTEKDFAQMQNWWENSFDKISVVEQRLIEMKTLLGRFRKLKEYAEEVHIRVERIKLYKHTGQPACVSPAHILGNIISLGLIDTAIKSYEDSSKKCWNHTKKLVNGLMCAVCDADNEEMFVSDTKKVVVSHNECLNFTNNCVTHLKSLWALTHYITFMNMMSKCNEKAEFKGSHEEITIDDYQMRAVNSCLHAKNIDDCAQVCRNQMGFSTKVKFESDALDKIMFFIRNVDREFGALAKKKRIETDKIYEPERKRLEEEAKKKAQQEEEAKKAAEKDIVVKIRLLTEQWEEYHKNLDFEDEILREKMGIVNRRSLQTTPVDPKDPKKDGKDNGDKDISDQEKNKSRTTQIDELGVLVRAKGLDLSKYTDKGADKFEDMNLELIFGKQAFLTGILTIAYFLFLQLF